MRVDNIHEPQAGVDVKVHTETTEEMKKKNLPTTQRRMMRVIIQRANRGTRRLSTTTTTSTSTKKAATTQTATPASTRFQKTEDELEPWVDYTTRATHKADELLAATGIESWFLRQGPIYWRQARMIAKHHEDCWTKLVSNWNPAISTKQQWYRKQGRPAKRWEDDLNIPLTTG